MSFPSCSHHGIQPKASLKRKYGKNMGASEVSYEWRLPALSIELAENRKYFDSPAFSAEDNDKIKWFLRLYPKGDKKENRDYLSLFLCLKLRNIIKVQATSACAILNDKQEEKNIRYLNTESALHKKRGYMWGFTQFIKRDILFHETSDLLVNGNLILYCKVSLSPNLLEIPRQRNANVLSTSSQKSTNFIKTRTQKKMIQVPDSHLSEDFGKLREDNDRTDVILNVSGNEFKAHKLILCARSPVFAAMFNHDMQESKQNRVEITDMDAETFKEMLDFIYTGKAPNIEEMAYSLLVAANYYGFDRLKAMCEEALSSNLSVENASHVLILADMHDAKQLRSFVLDFVSRHVDDVMATAGWKTVETDHPDLVSEVCRTLSKLSKPVEPILNTNDHCF